MARTRSAWNTTGSLISFSRRDLTWLPNDDRASRSCRALGISAVGSVLARVGVCPMSASRQERSFQKVFIMRFSHELAASRLSHGMDFSASTSLITPTSLMRI
jgi:hypothetical protein